MYSIKKLFYLSTAIKIQFYKTFILPYFDYCLSLAIYYSSTVLQKLCNCYNMCLCKLFNSTKQDKFNFSQNDPCSINKFLLKFNIFSFVHRLVIRLNLFLFKIVSSKRPPLLADSIKLRNNVNSKYHLRSFDIPSVLVPATTLHYGDCTFQAFFTKFYNHFLLFNINFNLYKFKRELFLNLDYLVTNFINVFPKFNLLYKFYKNYKWKIL